MFWFILIGLGLLYYIAFRFMQFAGKHSDHEQYLEDNYQMKYLKERKQEKEKRIDQHFEYLQNGYVRRE